MKRSDMEKNCRLALNVNENGFPVLRASINGDKFYIIPCKGYCLQTSRNMKGEGQVHSSQVVGLANILFADYERADKLIGKDNFNPTASNISYGSMGLYIVQLMVEAELANIGYSMSRVKFFGPDFMTLNAFIHAIAVWIAKVSGVDYTPMVDNFMIEASMKIYDDKITDAINAKESVINTDYVDKDYCRVDLFYPEET